VPALAFASLAEHFHYCPAEPVDSFSLSFIIALSCFRHAHCHYASYACHITLVDYFHFHCHFRLFSAADTTLLSRHY